MYIATCAIRAIPPAWIRQLADNGVIVAPMRGHGLGLMVLHKTAPDEVSGRFDSARAGFMPLRTSVDDPLAPGQVLGFAPGPIPHHGTTTLDPALLLNATHDLLLWLDLHLPGINNGHDPTQQQVIVTAAGAHTKTGLNPVQDQQWPVVQSGPCRLWDTIEHAMQQWHQLDRPRRNRLGITALDKELGQYVWLDDPDSPYAGPRTR